MKKRLDAARRLVHLQGQKVRLAETDLARLQGELQMLQEEERRLHGQIEGTVHGHPEIMDLLFRRLDQLTRRILEKQGGIAAAAQAVAREKIKGEAAGRLENDMQTLLQTDEDRRDLLDIIERVATRSGSSFR